MSSAPNVARGALLIAASELAFTSMGAAIKALTAELPFEMVVFFRNAIGLLVLLPWLMRRAGPGLGTRVLHLHLLRAAAGLSAMYCFFFALAHLHLADAVVLKMTAPIFIPLLAWLWLTERIGPAAALAAVVGFAGVVLLVKPPGEALNWVAVVGLGGGALVALAKVTIRRLTYTEPATRIVFYFAAIATLISALPLLWAWTWPSLQAWVLLMLLGTLATVGQLLMTRAYAQAEAGRIGPFTYVSVVFAAAYGWALWGEPLDVWKALGALLIVAAGILALHRPRATAAVGLRASQARGRP